MKVDYSKNFIDKLKKVDVRIHKSFRRNIAIFQKNPLAPQLNNHKLRKPYLGFRSIDITNNYRAIYEERKVNKEIIAYFSLFGTHEELYGKAE